MSSQSHIQWTDASWNPVSGCRKVSPGCDMCYAMNAAHRMKSNPNAKVAAAYAGLTQIQNGRVNWTGTVRELPDRLGEPFRWRTPKRIFVNSMSDLFHEDVSDGFIAQVWDVMGKTPWHIYQILTKRPERMQDWVCRWADCQEPGDYQLVRGAEATRAAHPSGRGQLFAALLESMGEPPPGYCYPSFDWAEGQRWWPRVLPNVWLGTSVEDQKFAGARVPALETTPAAVRFVSAEPLLGPLDLTHWLRRGRLHWVIVGGESGPGARACEAEWIASLIEQGRQTEVAVFVKQLGSRLAQSRGCRHPKGGASDEWPVGLRVREWPVAAQEEQ